MKVKMEKIVIGIFILVLIMVNPPFLGVINTFAKDTPIILGFPTVWLWLQFWYCIAIATFLIAAWRLPSWNKKKFEEGIK